MKIGISPIATIVKPSGRHILTPLKILPILPDQLCMIRLRLFVKILVFKI